MARPPSCASRGGGRGPPRVLYAGLALLTMLTIQIRLLVGTRNASIKSYRLTGGSLRMDNNRASWHLLGGHWQSSRFPPTPSRLWYETPCCRAHTLSFI